MLAWRGQNRGWAQRKIEPAEECPSRPVVFFLAMRNSPLSSYWVARPSTRSTALKRICPSRHDLHRRGGLMTARRAGAAAGTAVTALAASRVLADLWCANGRRRRGRKNRLGSPVRASVGLTRFDGHRSSGVPGRMSDHGEHGEEAPAAPCVHA
jgi:hypothetical protein